MFTLTRSLIFMKLLRTMRWRETQNRFVLWLTFQYHDIMLQIDEDVCLKICWDRLENFRLHLCNIYKLFSL